MSNQKELVLKEAVSKFLNVIKEPETREGLVESGFIFKRHMDNEMLCEINGRSFDKVSIVVLTIQDIMKYIGFSDVFISQYTLFFTYDVKDFDVIYNGYVSSTLSYFSNMQFVMKMYNKIFVLLIYKLFDKVYDLNNGIDIESITKDFVVSIMNSKLGEIELIDFLKGSTDVAPTKTGILGDKPEDWKTLESSIDFFDGDSLVRVSTYDDFNILKNKQLEKMFLEISNGNKKFDQHIFIMDQIVAGYKKESPDFPAVMYRHLLHWVIKSVIFGGDICTLKNYGIYWKYKEKLSVYFDLWNAQEQKGKNTVITEKIGEGLNDGEDLEIGVRAGEDDSKLNGLECNVAIIDENPNF